jgi:hypothetical protein
MTNSTHRKEMEGTMSGRILKTLGLALVLGGVFAGSAFAMPVTEPSVYSVSPSHHLIVSEKTAGLTAVVPGAHAVVSEKVAGLRADTLFANGVAAAPTIYSDHGVLLSKEQAGLSRTPAPLLASGGDGFNWSDAGVFSALTIALLLVLSAAVVGFRRHYSPLAH